MIFNPRRAMVIISKLAKKIKNRSHFVQKYNENKRTHTIDFITFLANAVGNKQWCQRINNIENSSLPVLFIARSYSSAEYLLSSCVCPSERHKPVLYRNNRKNQANFWHAWRLLYTNTQEIWLSPKIRVLSSATKSLNLDLPRQVDCVINKNRRRSSLLTTSRRRWTRRGCLLHIGQP